LDTTLSVRVSSPTLTVRYSFVSLFELLISFAKAFISNSFPVVWLLEYPNRSIVLVNIPASFSIGNTASGPASPTPITLGALNIAPFAYQSTDIFGTLGGFKLNSPLILKCGNLGFGISIDFNFKWELPKLKLPRISVQGKFSLAPPSVPKFDIEWRKEGAIFTKPYVFGNQGWGEAGPEAVLPIEKLAGILADTMDKLGYSSNQSVGNEFDINALTKLINGSNKETKLYLTVKVGEDTLTDKVVSNINRQSRINGETVVIV